ncbi:hypothetical protein DASB73_013300 [Starmerella bacillaris]|uniref:Sphingoid long-chain base transporter RSB1 n=1 Tax=Starmerella bacillaris TaxID=1247836 RepID=A0AAV5RGN7_STABA|nr:hypothetical protein DASB73_013300 [Starmerella bacillaris]
MSGNIYGFVPNLGANLAATILFGIITAFQFIFGILTREFFFGSMWVITAGAEVCGYVCRTISHFEPDTTSTEYKIQLVTLMIGPVFMAAGLYYQLGVLVTLYGRQYSLVTPRKYTIVFSTLDVIALFMQGAGGGIAAGQNPSSVNVGRWVMVGGIIFQVIVLTVFIFVFSYVVYRIFYATGEAHWSGEYARNRKRPLFKYWLPSVFVSLIFLEIRSIYRVVELSEGWNGPLMVTESYFLVLDGLMIFLGMLPLTIVFPGLAYGRMSITNKNGGLIEKVDTFDDEAELNVFYELK